jgi:hypothetical protein
VVTVGTLDVSLRLQRTQGLVTTDSYDGVIRVLSCIPKHSFDIGCMRYS